MRKNYSQKRTQIRRLKTIDEITGYIIANNGPDEEGRGHPWKKRIMYDDIDIALTIAQDRGFCMEVKPYHFRNTLYMYNHPWIVDEVIEKKIDQLLKEKYKGDIVELIKNISAKELLSPLIDSVNGKPIKVSMRRVGIRSSDIHHNSPFEMVHRYIKLKGWAKKFKKLKPYHFNRTPNSTFKNPALVDEVIEKKIDQLLKKKYKGNLVKFIINTGQKELMESLIDYLDGNPIKVSMAAVGNKVGDKQQSPFEIVSRYIKLKGMGRRKDLLRST